MNEQETLELIEELEEKISKSPAAVRLRKLRKNPSFRRKEAEQRKRRKGKPVDPKRSKAAKRGSRTKRKLGLESFEESVETVTESASLLKTLRGMEKSLERAVMKILKDKKAQAAMEEEGVDEQDVVEHFFEMCSYNSKDRGIEAYYMELQELMDDPVEYIENVEGY